MSNRASKFLSLVLRHDPARIGITLDDAGWTDVAALLVAIAAHGVPLTRDELVQIVASSDKQRFALSGDGERIRANQGHSVAVELKLPPTPPPTLLYHGTVEAALAGIRASGLVRGKRHHVHMSADLDTARKVGGRRGAPVILTVRAEAMADAGHVFYRSENGVWLVDHVPVEYLVVAKPSEPVGRASRGAKVGIANQTLAACEAGEYTNTRHETVPLRAAIDEAKAGTQLYELGPTDRVVIAEHTLADVESGRYVNARHEIVVIERAASEAMSGTVLHDAGESLRTRESAGRTQIAVTTETTIEALVRLARQPCHLGCLNFASAKNPGGGFLGGAQAQEESLARSSALYPCLLTQPAHYERNRANHSALYLDLAIYSPRVPMFRDDDGRWLERPVLASVITCAAPNAGALKQHGRYDAKLVEDTLRRRAELVLAVAAHHGIDRLVLGAWGAGAFRNDPAIVADAFHALLTGRYASCFETVVFPVMGGPNHDAFARRFA